MSHLLVIDNDPCPLPDQVRQAFPAPRHRVGVARTGADGLARFRADPPDVVLMDLLLPDQCGLSVHRQIRGVDARIPVIFVTRTRTAGPAIQAMKEGAYDCLYKPLDPRQLQQVVGEAVEVGRRGRLPAPTADAPDPDGEEAFVGSCAAMREVYKAVGRVASLNIPVLVTGESGTGKELVARAIHRHGVRADGPFFALNCAAIPEQLLESELFGHEKGAFTGADRRRIGRFEQCHGGTLLLDEIGDMPLALQAKMLRVLQEQAFQRVGGDETIRTDVRVVAATHRSLKEWSAEGRFRPDLYYRLGVFSIHLPPLRDRGEDLELLARLFVRRFGQDLAREARAISADALERLRTYDWPGNVRELQSVLKQALLRANGPVLQAAFLPELAAESRPQRDEQPEDPAAAEAADGWITFVDRRLRDGADDLYGESHARLDRTLLPLVLKSSGGNQNRAARVLGIARATLRRRLRELGLHITREVGSGALT